MATSLQNAETSRWHFVIHSIIAAGLMNFFLFSGVSALLGGVADPDSSGSGRYFLSSHGRVVETTRLVYAYSRAHFISIWIGLAASFIALAVSYTLPVPRQGISAPAAKCVLITFFLSVIGPVVLTAVIRLF